MNDRHHNGTNGGPTVQPEIVDPPAATGTAYPMPRNHGVPPGCVVVRKEFAYAIGGVAAGAILMWLALREMKGNR